MDIKRYLRLQDGVVVRHSMSCCNKVPVTSESHLHYHSAFSGTSLAAVKRNTCSCAEELQLEENYDTLLANVYFVARFEVNTFVFPKTQFFWM
jgi:hypothetical protein